MAVEHDDAVGNSAPLQSNPVVRNAAHYLHGHGSVNSSTHLNSPFTLGSAVIHSVINTPNQSNINNGSNTASASNAVAGFTNANSMNFGCNSQLYSPPSSPTLCKKSSLLTNSSSLLASGPDQTAECNWQSNKNNIRERNAAMINNELMSDITFLIGPCKKPIYAHKYVLSIGSAVFYAMFHGNLAESKRVIEIPDVEPVAFLALLRYLYCDDFCLEPDNVLVTLYAAKKYLVPNLARHCVEYLELSLTARNACLLLSQGRLFEELNLMQRCWEVIDAQAELALSSEGFTEIDFSTLDSILSRETLNAKEISIFNAAFNWAKSECQRKNIESTPENQRKVLGKAMYHIRIPTMSLEEYANGPAQSGLLTLQETTDIFLNFTARSKPSLMFITKKRHGRKVQVCHRFRSSAYRSNQWRYRGRTDSIQFAVDKQIFLVGFSLYGSSNGAADYKVRMELKRFNTIIAETHTKFFSDGSSNTFRLFFQNPIQVEADSYYTLSAMVDGSELSFFGQDGLDEVTVHGVTFHFQCSADSTNGTGISGGQIPELLFYGPLESSTEC